LGADDKVSGLLAYFHINLFKHNLFTSNDQGHGSGSFGGVLLFVLATKLHVYHCNTTYTRQAEVQFKYRQKSINAKNVFKQ